MGPFGEPDGSPTGIGGGDGRRADVEAARRDLGQQPREVGAHEIDLQTEFGGDGAQQFVVEAGEPAELIQMLGGASESVPTVRVPGVPSPSALRSMRSSGTTPGVVYRSDPGPPAAAARLVGSALALSAPGGAHWSAPEGGASASAASVTNSAATRMRHNRVIRRNLPGRGVLVKVGLTRNVDRAIGTVLARRSGRSRDRSRRLSAG